MTRNFKALEEVELKRLASLSSPSARRAREELARRESLAVFRATGESVEARREAARNEFADGVRVFTSKAEEPSEPPRKPKRKR